MLAIEVEFLLGRYVATDFRDREGAEWPPHPARLFSALVAAAHESGVGESGRAALLWLESLAPPLLAADGSPGRQTPVTVYVPVNDPKVDLLPQRGERQPRAFPSVVPSALADGRPGCVHFIWPDAQPDGLLRGVLADLAGRVTYLGSSRTPVLVRLTDVPPDPNWFPDDKGAEVLRVAAKGRLVSLEWHYRHGLRPPNGSFQRYRLGPAPLQAALPESVYGEMVVYRLTGPETMEIETTLRLTEALRAAVMRRSQDVLGGVPEVLSGHQGAGPSSSPHAAYLALPFVSATQPHADGRLLGLAVALPRSLAVQQRRPVVRALAGISHVTLPGVGRLGLDWVFPDQTPPYNLRPDTWTEPRRHWASVTPVVLDRFPKRDGRGGEDVVARSCEHVGLPRPVRVTVSRFSTLHGVEPSSRYCVRRRQEGADVAGRAPVRPFTHATLTFDREVRGPVLLGVARHFGLGLFRPLEEGRDGP